MTYISFFVAAYYYDKGLSISRINTIINNVDKKFINARCEYDCMKGIYTTEELTEWIRKRLKGSYLEKFNQTYKHLKQ